MSQIPFFSRFADLFFHLVLFLGLFISTIVLACFFFLNQNWIYYFAFTAMLSVTAGYGIRYAAEWHEFKQNLYLLLPQPQATAEFEPIDLEGEDKPLKAVILYHDGLPFTKIASEFGYSHPTMAVRLVRKGLGMLLKEHKQNGAKTI